MLLSWGRKKIIFLRDGSDGIGSWGREKVEVSQRSIKRVLRFKWAGLGASSQIWGKTTHKNEGLGLLPKGHFQSCREGQRSFLSLFFSLFLFWCVLSPLHLFPYYPTHPRHRIPHFLPPTKASSYCSIYLPFATSDKLVFLPSSFSKKGRAKTNS